MLTDYQRQLLTKLMDYAWEADNTANSYLMRDLARNAYWDTKQNLMDDMGRDEYENYIDGMRRMFAPAN